MLHSIHKWFTLKRLAVTVAGLALLFVTANLVRSHFSDSQQNPTASQYTKGEINNSTVSNTKGNNGPTSSTASDTGSSRQKDSPGTGSTTLVAPTGNFVSNHHPSLSGDSAPMLESSVCTSTPGAACKITFTKDGITKSLHEETTDSGGSVYWDWKLQDLDLTTGPWKITAIVNLNGQTKSTTDAMSLEVSP
jgi:hypothetical protein